MPIKGEQQGYTYKVLLNGEWQEVTIQESPLELVERFEQDEEWTRVRHGRRTSCQGLAEVGECQCSSCKTIYYTDDLYNIGETDENGCGQALLPNYCPHCGAQMDEVSI